MNAETSFRYLTFSLDADGIANVMLNRPPANAIDRDMYIEIAALFADPDVMGDVKAIVLGAEGRFFCAGNDLDEFATMTPDNGAERMWRVREAFFAIQGCPVPVIGAVHGAALGSGLAIAASCDFVVASPDARFGLPELTVGVMGGAAHLARVVAQPVVRRMFFTGEAIEARQLVDWGGAIFLFEGDGLIDEARRLARRVASFSPTAVRLAKGILNRVENMELQPGYAFEQGFTVRMSGHPDSKEALRAFAEKRPAEYAPRNPQWAIEA
ncbi:enoyl-CoA hydratase-related protein [Sphingomonas sp. 67-36]|uniref:enoyl-CoA hydratase-related protein n=1 Tax=Sphingomonas sp. 67-36 TaxID=1895849 RepID=UPI000927ECDE|nr:enoyl-CoA hydratase-related protein [Sphingomonas sp. 67-36]OJV27467.1 MAG: crotonase [Sphingomonas sp. 67-36]